MKLYPKRALAGLGAVAVAGGVVLAAAGSAFATPAPWQPDPHSIGSVTFLDANGVPITTGSTANPMAIYVVGSHPDTTDTYADLYYYLPIKGSNSGGWSGDQSSLDDVYGPTAPTSWPADVQRLVNVDHLPVIKEDTSDETLQGMIADYNNIGAANNSDPLWQNQYEVRLAIGGNTSSYDSADVSISGTTWTLESYPDTTVTTTTTLTATPANPDSTSANPAPVALTTKVTPSASVPAGFTGSPGTIQITESGVTTPVDTETVPAGAASPYTVTTNLNLVNPSSHTYTATFVPANGTAFEGSASAALPYSVATPAPSTTTSLNVTWGGTAGISNTYTGTVLSSGTAVTGGTVNIYDNGAPTPLNTTPLALDGTGSYTYSNTFAGSGNHSFVAVYSGVPSVYATSQSTPPVTESEASAPTTDCTPSLTGCTDQQTITGVIVPGVLSISTPYTAASPLALGDLALDTTGTFFTASATFGTSTTDPTQDILVTDTRAGDLNWTAQAQAANLVDTGTGVIDGQNVGLTALHAVAVPGNGFNTGGLVTTDNPAAAPAVAAGTPGYLGLGSEAHQFAQATKGAGSVGLYGTLTLNAPTSTEAGTYTGVVTFTIVGGIVANAN
jgi:hypothetical protein